MNFKLLSISFLYFFSYKSFNCIDENNSNIYKLFSITLKRGVGKKRKSSVTLTAAKYISTNIYHFDNNRFLTMDEMLDYILNIKNK